MTWSLINSLLGVGSFCWMAATAIGCRTGCFSERTQTLLEGLVVFAGLILLVTVAAPIR